MGGPGGSGQGSRGSIGCIAAGWTAAVVAGISAGLIDGALGLVADRASHPDPWTLGIPMGLSCLLVLICTLPLTLVACALGRRRGLRGGTLAGATAGGVVILFVLHLQGILSKLLPTARSVGGVPVRGLARTVELPVLGLLLTAGLYFLLRRVRWPSCLTRWTPRILTAGLLLLLLQPSILLLREILPHHTRSIPAGEALEIPRVVLLTVDTLRADALFCLGGANQTPRIDELAREGVLFERAYASSSWTIPSFASILTGLGPGVHQVMDVRSRLDPRLRTLAEGMADRGYRTAAIGTNPILQQRDYEQGIQDYRWFPRLRFPRCFGARLYDRLLGGWIPRQGTTEEITDQAVRWLEARSGETFFLWVHYMDPHTPYCPPRGLLTDEDAASPVGDCLQSLTPYHKRKIPPDEAERRAVRELYDAEVRHVDAGIGRILDTLRRLDLFDEALVVFLSDHGEEFWDHGGVSHGHTLHDELLRVPLMIKLPGPARPPARCPEPVALDTLTPTLLDLCGAPHDPAAYSQPSLAAWLRSPGESLPASTLAGATNSEGQLGWQESLIQGNTKYIHYRQNGREELFDLQTDLREQTPLTDPDLAARYRTRLAELTRTDETLRQSLGLGPTRQIELDERMQEELGALGYLP